MKLRTLIASILMNGKSAGDDLSWIVMRAERLISVCGDDPDEEISFPKLDETFFRNIASGIMHTPLEVRECSNCKYCEERSPEESAMCKTCGNGWNWKAKGPDGKTTSQD